MTDNKLIDQIIKDASKHLIGKKIVDVRYITKEEMKESYWYSRCPVLILDDGTIILPLSDDEGNEGGVLEIISSKNANHLLPRI